MRLHHADLDVLERPGDTGPGVLSLYLLTDPTSGPGRNLHAQVTDLAHELRATVRGAPEEVRRALDDQIERLRTLLDQPGTRPRSLAIFASPAWETVRQVRLMTRFLPEAHWGPRPYLAPLLAALDEHERMLVLLIDKAQARVFDIFADEIERVCRFASDVPPHHREVGGAPSHLSPEWSQGGWGRWASICRA